MTINDQPKSDWNPKAADVVRDQRAAYDAMREKCPVAYSDLLHWSLFRHMDVPGDPPGNACYPASGFSRLPLLVTS